MRGAIPWFRASLPAKQNAFASSQARTTSKNGDKDMTRKLTTIAASLLLLGAMGFAQTRFTLNQTQVVTVPFSFAAGSRTLPAGTYNVQIDSQNNVVILRGENQPSLMLLANPEELQQPSDKSQLIFKRYGSYYVLKNICTEASAAGESLIPVTLEKEIAHNQKAAVMVAVQAS